MSSIADVILHNARILTMNAGQPVADALAMCEGVILAVGEFDDVRVRKGRVTRLIDLEGRYVVPGFIGPRLPREPAVAGDAPTFDDGADGGRGAFARTIEDAICRAVQAGFTTVRDGVLGAAGGLSEFAAVLDRTEIRRLRIRGAAGGDLRDECRRRRIRPGLGNDMVRMDAVSMDLTGETPWEALSAEASTLSRGGWQVDFVANDSAGIDQAIALATAIGRSGRHVLVSHEIPDGRQRDALAAAKVGWEGPAIPGKRSPEASRALPNYAAAGVSRECREQLLALTAVAARRYGIEDVLGRLDVGKRADLTILDSSSLEDDLLGSSAHISATWVEGIPVTRA